MKRLRKKSQYPQIPSNLNTRTHSYDKRYTPKEMETRINWNSLKWLIVCVLIGWGAFQMGRVIERTSITMPPPVANSSISN